MTIAFRVLQYLNPALQWSNGSSWCPYILTMKKFSQKAQQLLLIWTLSSRFHPIWLKLLPMPKKQDGSQIVVIPVDRCILLPACPLLARLCSTLPPDPDHLDCACFRQRVCQIVSLLKPQLLWCYYAGDSDWSQSRSSEDIGWTDL